MILDFTNYTFSGLIALLAAILGIGYPLFLESIRKIDEQYDSTRLSARFQKELVFYLYSGVLVLAIAVSFCAPFVMLLFPIDAVSVVVLTVQALAVLILVFLMLAVFRVIQEYYDPDKLIRVLGYPSSPDDPIIADKLSKNDLMCLIDLMRYTARRNNREVYNKCKYFLVHLVNNEESKIEKGQEYNVSQDFIEAFRQIADYSKNIENVFLYNDNVASQVFYNYFFKYEIGLLTYQLLWQSACVVAEGGTDEWFRQHWSYADQYYTFHFEHKRKYNDKDVDLYKEQHYMLGVLALHYKRFDWLRIVLFHSQTYPPKYSLVPSTFSAIIDTVRPLERQRLLAWQLSAKYQMKGLFGNVDSDDQILILAYRYAALLFIRLFSVNDYNITYSDPMKVPSVDTRATIYENKTELKIVESIKQQVDIWYSGDELQSVELPVLPDKDIVENLLDQYKSAIENQMQYNIAHPVLDKKQMEALKGLLVEADKQMVSSIPANANIDSDDRPITIFVSNKIDNQFCTVGGLGSWSNYPEVLITYLNEKMNSDYDGLLGTMPVDVFTINERNIFKALTLLRPDKDDVILSMGVYLPNIDSIYNEKPMLTYNNFKTFYNDAEIETRSSYQSSIIIIRREYLPVISYLPPSEDMTNQSLVELTGSPTHLCSNIDQVISENKPSPVIRIGRNIKSFVSPYAKCVRIVVNKNVDDTVELGRLEQFVSEK